MSDAPEKVWVSVECDDDGGYLELMPEDAASPDFDTEYTRSDLCITRAEAAAMVAAERQKWEKLAASQYEAGHKAGWNAVIRAATEGDGADV